MHYCSYHPLAAAAHQCESCYRQQCDSCVGVDGHCFVCGQLTQELGMEHRVEPFCGQVDEPSARRKARDPTSTQVTIPAAGTGAPTFTSQRAWGTP